MGLLSWLKQKKNLDVPSSGDGLVEENDRVVEAEIKFDVSNKEAENLSQNTEKGEEKTAIQDAAISDLRDNQNPDIMIIAKLGERSELHPVESFQGAVKRNAAFDNLEAERFAQVDADVLKRIEPGRPEPLTPPEIRFLYSISGCPVDQFRVSSCFTADYNMDFAAVMEKLFSSGYLTFGDVEDSLKQSTVPILRSAAKSKGLKTGGRKDELIQRILENCSSEELESLNLAQRYVLTESGTALLEENDALLRYYRNLDMHEWTTPEEVVTQQRKTPDLSGEEILSLIIERRTNDPVSFFGNEFVGLGEIPETQFVTPDKALASSLQAIAEASWRSGSFRLPNGTVQPFELNFQNDNVGHIACYLPGQKFHFGIFMVTNQQYVPELVYLVKAHIRACAISPNGLYAICQTSVNTVCEDDSDAVIVIDVNSHTAIGKGHLLGNRAGIRGITINEQNLTYTLSYADRVVEFNFHGKPTNTQNNEIEEAKLALDRNGDSR